MFKIKELINNLKDIDFSKIFNETIDNIKNNTSTQLNNIKNMFNNKQSGGRIVYNNINNYIYDNIQDMNYSENENNIQDGGSFNQIGGGYIDYLLFKILDHHKHIKFITDINGDKYYKILLTYTNNNNIKMTLLNNNNNNNILSQGYDILKSYLYIYDYNKSNLYLLAIKKDLFTDIEKKDEIIKHIEKKITIYNLIKDVNGNDKKFNISKCIKFFLMIDNNDFFINYYLYENLLFFLFSNME